MPSTTDSTPSSKTAYRAGGSAGHVDSGSVESVVEGAGEVVDVVGTVPEVVDGGSGTVDDVTPVDCSGSEERVGSGAESEQDVESNAIHARRM
ncbi:MAG: hypothetical protein ACLFWM_03125 [Actinomycetota bacterium]